MNTEIVGFAICIGITAGLAVICWVIAKVLSAITDRMLPDSEDQQHGLEELMYHNLGDSGAKKDRELVRVSGSFARREKNYLTLMKTVC